MSEICIQGNVLEAEFQGIDVARARRLSLKVHLDAIRAVSVGIPVVALRETPKFWGSYDAGVMLVGFEEAVEGHRETFYEVRHPERAVTLELERGRFEFIVLEPSNIEPAQLAQQIEQALGKHLPSAHLPPGLMPVVPEVPQGPLVAPAEHISASKDVVGNH